MKELILHKSNIAKKNIIVALYLYLALLFFEGAIRRWMLPQLSGPLLLIRDPVAIYIIYMAFRYRFIQWNVYLFLILIIAFISFYTTIYLGHGNIYIALYGLRIFLFHFPLIFIIEKVFRQTDFERIAYWTIILSIPMLLLIIFQFYSPQNAWINKGLGDNMEGAGFIGAKGYFRPPGTFSFTNGLVLFFTYVSVFVFWGLTNQLKIPKWLLILALFCVFISIPFSISRTLFFSIGATFIFYLFTLIKNSYLFWRLSLISIFSVLLLVYLSNADFFSTSIDVFRERFEKANESEGGIEGVVLNRFLGSISNSLDLSSELPFWGYGLGLGTNVGSLLNTGQLQFIISEGEWGRVIGEMGALLGISFILIRIFLALKMIRISFRGYMNGSFLPLLLLFHCIFNIVLGQWAQPTTLGFSIFFGGMLMASKNFQTDDSFAES
ncbi:MAG: hypothetical protein ACK55K_06240 [Bacteroidota bacterium]